MLTLCAYVWGGQYLTCYRYERVDCEFELRRWFGTKRLEYELFQGIRSVTRRSFVRTQVSTLTPVPNRGYTRTSISEAGLLAETDTGQEWLLGGLPDEVDHAAEQITALVEGRSGSQLTVSINDILFARVASIFGFVVLTVGLLCLYSFYREIIRVRLK